MIFFFAQDYFLFDNVLKNTQFFKKLYIFIMFYIIIKRNISEITLNVYAAL